MFHSILQLRAKEPTMCLLFFFSTIELTVGLCCRGVRGAYGAVERRHAAPPSSADSAWFLTQNSGFAGHDDGRTDGRNRVPPPFSSNRKPQRNSDLDFRFFAVSSFKYCSFGRSRLLFFSIDSVCSETSWAFYQYANDDTCERDLNNSSSNPFFSDHGAHTHG